MVGALTVLIVIVAVFLAYNANNGLPFVPTYRISANVPNANSLVEGNDVRVGGVRVGVVETIEPELTEDPETGEEIYGAQLNLKLDRSVEPLPADSTLIIRSRSALGLKFLEVTPGRSDEGLPEGGELPITQARPEPVELDEVFSTFDEATRRYSQENLVEFGNAIAGRGGSLNAALFELAPLTRRPHPGHAQHRLKGDRPQRLPPRARGDRGRGCSRCGEPGEHVRGLEPHVRGAGDRRPALHPGHDHERPGDRAGLPRHDAADPAVPGSLGGAVHRLPARRPGAREHRADAL